MLKLVSASSTKTSTTLAASGSQQPEGMTPMHKALCKINWVTLSRSCTNYDVHDFFFFFHGYVWDWYQRYRIGHGMYFYFLSWLESWFELGIFGAQRVASFLISLHRSLFLLFEIFDVCDIEYFFSPFRLLDYLVKRLAFHIIVVMSFLQAYRLFVYGWLTI